MRNLDNRKIAILATDGFEQVEFTAPKKALEDAGATVHVIAPGANSIKAWNDTDWGQTFDVDQKMEDTNPSDYDGLLLPGGVINPDKLRRNTEAVNFVKTFFQEGKPIAAICHAPQMLIETGALEGRKVTSFNSIKTDLINAGANWVDEEVVVDSGLVTSRNPDDLPAFNKKMVEEFAEGVHMEQMTA